MQWTLHDTVRLGIIARRQARIRHMGAEGYSQRGKNTYFPSVNVQSECINPVGTSQCRVISPQHQDWRTRGRTGIKVEGVRVCTRRLEYGVLQGTGEKLRFVFLHEDEILHGDKARLTEELVPFHPFMGGENVNAVRGGSKGPM